MIHSPLFDSHRREKPNYQNFCLTTGKCICSFLAGYDKDDDFRFNNTSTREGHLRQNGISICLRFETALIKTGQVWHGSIKLKDFKN